MYHQVNYIMSNCVATSAMIEVVYRLSIKSIAILIYADIISFSTYYLK